MGVLSASSLSKSNLPDNGSLAGPMHRARAETRSRVGVRGGVVRSATAGGAREACAAYAGVPEGPVYLSAAGAGASMQAWWRKVRFKAVVLCRQPPNHAFEGSAQQRARCWVPSSLRSSAPPQRNRSASCGSADSRRVAGMQAIVRHPVAAHAAKGPVVVQRLRAARTGR